MSRTEWRNPATAAGPGGSSWGQRGLHSSRDACPLHGGYTFRGTRASGASLTHSPVHNLKKQGHWEALSCKPTLGHRHFKFSTSALRPASPGELRQFIQPRCWITESICSFQPAWNMQPEWFSFFNCWTCMGSCFLWTKPDSQKKSYWQ